MPSINALKTHYKNLFVEEKLPNWIRTALTRVLVYLVVRVLLDKKNQISICSVDVKYKLD